jgi:TetR/AcrR family transcriptional regulator, transcriptional repressor for nem operon
MQRASQKQINRETLLNQGVILLMQQGYHGTGLKEILEAVKIPKGSFYNYFGCKENFAAEVIQYYIDPFLNQLNRHLQNTNNDALTALQSYFSEIIMELERSKFQGGCLIGNLIGEIGDTSEICQKSLKLALLRYRNLLKQGLSMAQRQGSVRTDKSAEEMADLLVNLWQGALLRMKIEQSTIPLKQCCDNLLGALFRA